MTTHGFKLLNKDGTSLNGRFQYQLPNKPGQWGPWNEVPGNGCYVAVTSGVGICADPRNANLLFLEVKAQDKVDVRHAPFGVRPVPFGVRCFRNVRFRIPTQERLAKIASNRNLNEDIRTAATARLEDQSVLARIARGDSHWKVRLAATERITDQAVLARIATEDREWVVRFAATERITDQAVLARIATEDRDWGGRLAATKRLTDQSALARIAKEDKYPDVRIAAAERLEQLKQENNQ